MERKLLLVCSAILFLLIALVPDYSVNRIRNTEIMDGLRMLAESTDQISKVEMKTTDRLYLAVEYSLTRPLSASQRDSIFISTQDYILSEDMRRKLTQELTIPDPRLFAEGISVRFRYRTASGQDTYWIYSLTDREDSGGPRWDVVGPREDGSHGVIATWYPEGDTLQLDSNFQNSAAKRDRKSGQSKCHK
ncbi:hypothetical protein [Paenibacillus senegalensis]|uniref:hypothetical protein n=1 Tax=Paenibacillus senegalensis TaxID=1465766 RepID=UPI0002897BC4|nr:hypothetical protein [Paenibacillus senegalensis]